MNPNNGYPGQRAAGLTSRQLAIQRSRRRQSTQRARDFGPSQWGAGGGGYGAPVPQPAYQPQQGFAAPVGRGRGYPVLQPVQQPYHPQQAWVLGNPPAGLSTRQIDNRNRGLRQSAYRQRDFGSSSVGLGPQPAAPVGGYGGPLAPIPQQQNAWVLDNPGAGLSTSQMDNRNRGLRQSAYRQRDFGSSFQFGEQQAFVAPVGRGGGYAAQQPPQLHIIPPPQQPYYPPQQAWALGTPRAGLSSRHTPSNRLRQSPYRTRDQSSTWVWGAMGGLPEEDSDDDEE